MATTQQPEQATSTAVATQVDAKGFAVALLERYGSRIEALLPAGVSLHRVAATLRLEIMKNPKIAECTPASLIQSIGRIVGWGLEIGTTAYVVPFYDSKKQLTEATAIMGYTGMVELMIASGAVRAVQARAVHANDQFEYQLGLEPKLQHIPDSHIPTRGPIIGAYCILHLGRGADPVFDYMGIDEIEAIRAKSKQWGPGRIKECPDWYGVKTIIRRTAKLVPTNPRLARTLSAFEDDIDLDPDAEVGAIPGPARARIEAPRGPKPLTPGDPDDPYKSAPDRGAAVNNAPVPPGQFADQGYEDIASRQRAEFGDDDVPGF